MAKKYLFIFLFLIFSLSGCVTVEKVPPVMPPEGFALGTVENPIVDSNITLNDALQKYAPSEFKARQKMIEVLYYSFDGKVHRGQIVIEKRLVSDIKEVFRVAFNTKFPIQSVIPISHNKFYSDGEYNRDNQSMLANNTSGFNYRKVTGGKVLSMHSYGFALDINPVQNPYIKGNIVLPEGAVYNPNVAGTLTRNCPVVRTFRRLGWTWGGRWKSLKDYQHFEKVLNWPIN